MVLRRIPAWGLALGLVLGSVVARPSGVSLAQSREPGPLTVRITSPLGRTGTSGTIRIVAQITAPPPATVREVRYFVDGKLLGTRNEGPPYAIEWIDENPFEPREISVEAFDSADDVGRDTIMLPPYEVVEAAQVASVLLDVSVYDDRGRFVLNLGKDEFQLEENHHPQEIDLVSQEEVPGTFALLVDSSQSMAQRFGFVRLAAERFASYLRPRDQIVVAPFSAALGALTGPTNDQHTIGEAISAIKAKGGTAILDCLKQMADHLEGMPGRHAIVLITDGYDEKSSSSSEEVAAILQKRHVTTYVVAIGGIAGISLKGERLLRQLAEATGGKAFFPPREQDLVQVYDALATDAQHRYLVTYTPTDQTADGSWREIELAARTPKLVVRTRPGYFAPKPPPIRPSLEFTVTDASKQYVDVAADNLQVFEDGVEQKIESFEEAISPVSLVLAIDSSGSMRRVVPDVIRAAVSFVDSLRKEDSLGVMTFADKVELVQDLSIDRQGSLNAIADYKAVGGTALYDALDESLVRLSRVQGRRVVVVLTDGRDEDNPGTGPGSVHHYDDVVSRLRATGATVFAIGLGTKVDRKPLEQLATLSGGEAYFPSDVSTLADQYRRIVENLRRRWVLSYTSTNSKHDGSWRTVEIRPRSASERVASGGGYFAPEK